MKKMKLKKFVVPLFSTIIIAVFFIVTYISFKIPSNSHDIPESMRYVSSSILSNEIPVMSTNMIVKRPYNVSGVTVGHNFYDYKDEKDIQQKSILFYENTYIQNSGIDYVMKDAFDVLCVYDGIVTKVEENSIVGNTVEVKHDNNVISVYQSLSDIKVKEGDSIKQGDIIGKSGKSKISANLENHLHFEIYINGQVLNPEDCYDKELSKLQS